MNSTEHTNPLDALDGLLAERRRFEGWLTQLDSRRADSPAHVVDRVRADYLGRLDAVTQQLRGSTSELEAAAGGLRARIAALEAEESARRDERAETELRSLVGEFEREEAERSITSCDEAIARIAGERNTLGAELARVTEILTLIAPPPDPTSVPEPVVNEVRVGEAVETSREFAAPMSHTNPPAPDARPLAGAEASQLDELAFLQSVVESHETTGTLPAEPSPAESTLRTVEQRSDLLPPPVLAAPRRPTPLSTAIPTTRDPFAASTKGSMLTPGSIPSFFKDMPTEQVKTLKCQECGTMNYPTEWYCERCGGELAAM